MYVAHILALTRRTQHSLGAFVYATWRCVAILVLSGNDIRTRNAILFQRTSVICTDALLAIGALVYVLCVWSPHPLPTLCAVSRSHSTLHCLSLASLARTLYPRHVALRVLVVTITILNPALFIVDRALSPCSCNPAAHCARCLTAHILRRYSFPIQRLLARHSIAVRIIVTSYASCGVPYALFQATLRCCVRIHSPPVVWCCCGVAAAGAGSLARRSFVRRCGGVLCAPTTETLVPIHHSCSRCVRVSPPPHLRAVSV